MRPRSFRACYKLKFQLHDILRGSALSRPTASIGPTPRAISPKFRMAWALNLIRVNCESDECLSPLEYMEMDVTYINPFVKSIRLVFETMVHTKVQIGKPLLRSGPGPAHDISGVIGFSGDAVGCIILSFPQDVACKVATAFAGTTVEPNSPDLSDAIGELANMIAGSAKASFAGMDISISLPSVVMGKGHKVSTARNCPFIVIPCDTDLGVVEIEIGMTIEKSAAGRKTSPVGATA